MRLTRCFAIVLALTIPSFAIAQETKKRPITHADYEIWNTATGISLSSDGTYFVYFLNGPGDGSFVVKNIRTNAEVKIPTGKRAVALPTAPTGGDEEIFDEDQQPPTTTPPATPGPAIPLGGPTFTPDSKFVYFVVLPLKAEVDKAKAEKKKPEEMPRAVIAKLELSTGKIVERIEKMKSFQIVGEGAGLLVLEKEPKTEPAATTTPETAPKPKEVTKPDDDEDQPKGPKGPNPGTPFTPRPTTGSEYVFRDLATGKEASFADVGEFHFTKDFQSIAYSVISKTAENNGVFLAPVADPTKAVTLKKGAGKYSRVTWNKDQSQIAFFHDDTAKATPPTPATPGKIRVYLSPKAGPAVEVLGPTTTGMKKDWQIVDRAGLAFTLDGKKLLVTTAPIPEPEKKADTTPATDKIDLDLWHWKDVAIQPMQKIRAGIERNRSHRAVYFLDTKEFKQVNDVDRSVNIPDFGDWGIANNDQRYRAQTWNYPPPSDYAFANIRTGELQPIAAGIHFSVSLSPHGKFAAWFDGKNWCSISQATQAKTNLTGKLAVKFFYEDHDSPSISPSYGFVGWTSDDQHIIVSDKYDLWKLAADGSSATNLTQIGREGKIRFRYVRSEKTEVSEDEPSLGLDLGKSWLLAAENLETRDTGFYRLEPGQKPKMLVMGARKYSPPTKAKKGDTMVLTVSTFKDYPDYFATTSDFRELKRITDINPRMKEFLWGTSELLSYKSLDGTPLRATLYKPENFDPTKKYPMIVYIYERLTDKVHDFRMPGPGTSINPTYYTSNGYLVLMPDVSFKIGYPGQSSLKCVLSAIQAVADKGIVNEKAIGIQGHSWGGYQIAYMVTQTNRFAAAIAGAPVSNMISAYGGIRWGSGLPRQFQYEKTQSRIGETIWQAPMKYIENSPIFMADRVTTPLMMLHNDADDAVPWYQGIEYYLALRRLGKEVYMLNYNGQPHGLVKKSAARDYTLRMQQFFDHHLKGAAMPEWMAKGVPFLERDKEKEAWKKMFSEEKK